MRMRSPMIEPPEYGLLGSMAMIPTLWPALRRRPASTATMVDFPLPGHGVDALRYPVLERGELPLLLHLRRGLDAQEQLVHPRTAPADDDPVLTAVAFDLVERCVDLARVHVLAPDGEHVVDAPED